MAVFLDIYGNEARVLIDAKEFGLGKVRHSKRRSKTDDDTSFGHRKAGAQASRGRA
jgi:hypothetical protein